MEWDIDPAEFLAILEEFRTTSADLLRSLNIQLLRLERDPSDATPIREMLQSAHTIKGSAGMLGLDDVQNLAHALEDVLMGLRDTGSTAWRPELADMLFQGLDELGALIDIASPEPTETRPTTTALITRLRAWITQTPPPATTQAPPRILLVEDSATIRTLETMTLTEAGYQVEAVGDGKHALTLAQTQHYDLVITGAYTRGMPGLELAAALDGRNAPVILISSDDSPEQRQRAATAQVHTLLRRSVSDQQPFLDAVTAVVGEGTSCQRILGTDFTD